MHERHPTELGNLIREAAEGHQQKPAHTLILGVKDMQAHFARMGKPSQPDSFNLAGDKASDFPHKSCNFTFCEVQ